jgi:Zn-dependent protease with chaperone function
MDPGRTALLFAVQPVFSFLLATGLLVLLMRVFPPRRPALAAWLWLLPLAKVLLDLVQANPAQWIGSHGVEASRLRPGSRMGTLSLGLGGPVVPAPFGSARLEATPPQEPGTAGACAAAALSLHPADLLHARLGPRWSERLALGLAGGALALILLRLLRLLRYRRWLAGRLASGRPLDRHPDVLLVPGLSVPFATGFLTPRILVPAELAGSLPPDQLDLLIAHERAHVACADPLVRLVLAFAGDLFWYVPGLRACIRRFEAEREAACDDAARGSEAERSASLARALLGAHDHVHGCEPAPAWAPAAVDPGTLRCRLDRLLRPARPATRGQLAIRAAVWAYLSLMILRSTLGGLD